MKTDTKMASFPSPTATLDRTRRKLLQRIALGLGAVSLRGGDSAFGQSEPRGRIVTVPAVEDWQMSPGRTISYKLMSEHTGDALAVFEEVEAYGYELVARTWE